MYCYTCAIKYFFFLHLVKNSVETMPLIILPLIKYFESTTLTVWLWKMRHLDSCDWKKKKKRESISENRYINMKIFLAISPIPSCDQRQMCERLQWKRAHMLRAWALLIGWSLMLLDGWSSTALFRKNLRIWDLWGNIIWTKAIYLARPSIKTPLSSKNILHAIK